MAKAKTALSEGRIFDPNGAMVLTTPAGIVERWDEDAEQLLGFASDEAVGKTLQSLVIPVETTDELSAKLDLMSHDGHVQHLESVWKDRNGAAMYVSVMISPIRDSEDDIKAASIAVWDISGRKADETRLQLFRALLDRSSDAIEVIDQTTLRYLDVNETACSALGYSRNELLSMRVPDIDQDLSISQWKELDENLQARHSITIESFHRRKDGSRFPVEVNISLVRIADRGFRIAVVRDISERRSDEVNLKIFRALLDKAGDGIEVLDPITLRILDMNEAICRMHGYSREELLSMRVSDLDPDIPKETLMQVNKTLQAERSATLESVHQRKDGSRFPVEVSISLVRIGDRDYRLAVVRDISERKKAEEAQALFRSLIDNSNDSVEVIEPDTLRFLDVNETGCRALGYSREEMLTMRVPDIDNASENRNREIDERLRTSGTARFESTHRRKDGSTFPVEISIRLIELDRPYLLSIARDITERKQVEALIRKKEAQLEESQWVGHLGHWEWNIAANRGSCSDEVYRIFGREPAAADFTLEGFLRTIYADDRAKAREMIHGAINADKPTEADFRIVTPGGDIRWVHIKSTMQEDASGNPSRIFGTLQDITERKLAENLLLESENRLRAILDGALDGIAVVDVETQQIATINPAMCRMLGYSPDEMRRMHVADIHPEKDLPYVQEQFARQARGEIQIASDTPVKRKDGSVLYADINTSRVHLGGRDYLVGIFRDITERKHAEEELRRTNRALKLLSRCSTALVHAEEEHAFLEEICRLAVETGGYMLAWIGMAENDADKSIRPVAQSGFEDGYLENAKISWADTPLGQGPTGTAIRTGKTEINPDCLTNPKMAPWREAIMKRGYQSSIALPLIYRNQTLGALTIYAAEPHAFYEQEVSLLQELANEISYGIETIRTRIEHEKQGVLLRQSLEQSIQAIADTVEARDPYTAGHQRNVADLAVAIAQEMKLPADRIHGIRLAAIIHDLGKIHIPAEILSRPGKLTDIEYQMIRTHPQAGYDIVKGIEFPWPIAEMVLQHHERLDGSGYPQGLKGKQILPGAMIIAVADVVEAVSSHRPYRGGLGIEAALNEIERNRGVLYDPAVVDACTRLFREHGFSLPTHSPLL